MKQDSALARWMFWPVPNLFTATLIPVLASVLHMLCLLVGGNAEWAFRIYTRYNGGDLFGHNDPYGLVHFYIIPRTEGFLAFLLPPALIIFVFGFVFPKYRSFIDWGSLLVILVWLNSEQILKS